MAAVDDNISLTLGALVGGCLAAVGLSAIVGFQTVLYFQLFPMDTLLYKCLVAWIWITDTGHTVAVCTIIWDYAVMNFNNPGKLSDIVPAYPVHIILTVIATLNANAFYTWRVHKMSKSNWCITGPLVLHVMSDEDRFGNIRSYSNARHVPFGNFNAADCPDPPSSLLAKTKTYSSIHARLRIPEVASWTVSGITDIVISLARYYYLRDFKQGYMTTQEMVDAVVIFTINDGLLTCATVIALIACFLGMRQNFVWIGLFFLLAKLFSHSVLATLNLRNWFRHRHRPMGIPLTRQGGARNTLKLGHPPDKRVQSSNIHNDMHHTPATVEVFVDQEVEFAVGKKYDEANEHSESSS
ncbi:hypothetical protein MSAN_01181300 [Mycena sanguinolenta]|uniref:DUF6534 domain-containing protein n=1 Tax=Mycena sanguinolenta TaxID=230812 RepID=A0A8H7D4T7_9AGAR|nr:hypothetical protein MSAN_01181300 [Mycena sanguinolenta]